MGILIGLIAVVIIFLLIVLFASIKVVQEYERGVVFRLGRLRDSDYGPGLFLLIPIVDRMVGTWLCSGLDGWYPTVFIVTVSPILMTGIHSTRPTNGSK